MVNTRKSKAATTIDAPKKPTSRPKKLTKASDVMGDSFKPRKSSVAKSSTAKPVEIKAKTSSIADNSVKITQPPVQETVLEKETSHEEDVAGIVVPEVIPAASPNKGFSTVNPEGMTSATPAVLSGSTVATSEAGASTLLIPDLVKKSMRNSGVGDQVVVGGGTVSIADLVARIQSEVMAALSSSQAVRVAEQTVELSGREKSVEERKNDQAEKSPGKAKEVAETMKAISEHSEEESDSEEVSKVEMLVAAQPTSKDPKTVEDQVFVAEQVNSKAGASVSVEVTVPTGGEQVQDNTILIEDNDEDSEALFGSENDIKNSSPVETKEVPAHEEKKDSDSDDIVASESDQEKASPIEVAKMAEPKDKEVEPAEDSVSVQSSDEETDDQEPVQSEAGEEDSDPSTVPSASSGDSDELSPIANLKKPVSLSKKRSAPKQKKSPVTKKVKFEKKSKTVQGSLIKGVWFSSSVHAERWSVIQHRSIVAEKVLNVKKYPGLLVDLLSETKLLGSLRKAGKFSEKLVREVIVNLPAQFGTRGSEHYGQLRVRGKAAYITPELINVCLDSPQWSSEAVPDDLHIIAREITQGVKVHWKGTNFKASELSTKYSFLYQIAHYNWMPSTHRGTVTKDLAKLIYAVGLKKRINLGELVFAHLEKHSVSARDQLPIGFPSLIHRLVLEQFPQILVSGESLSPDPKVFAMDHKLFTGSRVVDVPSGTAIRVPEKILMPVSIHMKFAKEVRGQITFLENEIKRMQVQRVQLQDLLADLGTLSSADPGEDGDDSAEE